jgi:hypothetical protein
MQAVESQTLILYHTDLRGQWPEEAARAFAARLPYARRLAMRPGSALTRASLAGTALAVRALGQILGRIVGVGELVFAQGRKPHLAGAPDFSISHSGPWVGCAALAHGQVGFDVEMGTDARSADWVVREAALKASGEGLRAVAALRDVDLRGEQAHWRGERWHLERLELFADASACVVSSHPLGALRLRAVPLAELFAA